VGYSFCCIRYECVYDMGVMIVVTLNEWVILVVVACGYIVSFVCYMCITA
jgi:hypothetical protein